MGRKALNSNVRDFATGAKRRKRAVSYLRVSTLGQVQTDYDPEGISIPAQRVAIKNKADELGADVVREFVEPGRSAKTVEKRPRFQEMIAWVKAQGDIDYVIVYHFNRVFRNAVDAGITKRDLKKVGTRVVSTRLDMGDNPEASLIETILHAVDQYQSEASGADISYKMGQKVKNGGSVGIAKLGYLNVREPKPDGGEVRTVAVDQERAPLIAKGFELYATGQHTGEEVLAMLTAAGLRTRGTKSTPSAPLSLSRFYEVLGDDYYIGFVWHDGEQFEGRHQRLVEPEVFDQVQRILELHGGGGTRNRRHDHFLKGSLWCQRCASRFIISPGSGNGGQYFYFLCRGRQQRTCDQAYLPLYQIEAAVERHYATVQLSDEFRAEVRKHLDDSLIFELDALKGLKKRLSARLVELEGQEDRWLELVNNPKWPQAKIEAKLAEVERERGEIETQLADTTSTLEEGRQFLTLALRLLSSPQEFYRRAGSSLKKAMTRLIFSKLFVDSGEVAAQSLTDGFAGLVAADTAVKAVLGGRVALSGSSVVDCRTSNSPLGEEGAAVDQLSDGDLLAAAITGRGSSSSTLVEVPGIEPGSCAGSSGLLRAQSAVSLLGPTCHANKQV